MDDEYAKFGLPEDPANQPVPPNPPMQPIEQGPPAAVQRSWFLRSLWWLLPAAFIVLLLPCGCCGGMLWWLIGSMKSSEPYRMALQRVRANPKVIEQLGEPIEESSWTPTGNFSFSNNNGRASGKANFDFTVAGSKGTAHVHADMACRNGKWVFRVLEVTPASTGKTISLPADEQPGKAEDEGPASD